MGEVMISIQAAAMVIFYLVIAGLVFWLFYWLLNYSKASPPEPFLKNGNVVLAVLAVFVCVGILLSLVGGVPIFRP